MNSSYSVLPPVAVVTAFRQPKVGDILVSTWGYEQTNADFYEVVGVTGKSVNIRQLEEKETSEPGNWMFGKSVPVRGVYRGTPSRKLVKVSGTSYYVKINSYASAWLWDGQPVSVSHTH